MAIAASPSRIPEMLRPILNVCEQNQKTIHVIQIIKVDGYCIVMAVVLERHMVRLSHNSPIPHKPTPLPSFPISMTLQHN